MSSIFIYFKIEILNIKTQRFGDLIQRQSYNIPKCLIIFIYIFFKRFKSKFYAKLTIICVKWQISFSTCGSLVANIFILFLKLNISSSLLIN